MSEESPFEKIKIGLQYTSHFNQNIFHNTWQPSGGIKGFFETPFYFGRAQVGLKLMYFRTKDLSIPEFISWFVYGGWGMEFKLLRLLRLYSGLNIGSFQMKFEDEDIEPGLRSENELGIEFMVRFSFEILKNTNLNIEGSYLQVFTNQKINLFYVSAGIDFLLNTPDWLRDFLN